MVKIEIDDARREQICRTHMDGLKGKILNAIHIQKIKYTYDRKYFDLLDYFEMNLEKILVGNRNDLNEIIVDIESKYFISDRKLTKILLKRESMINMSRKEKRNKLLEFAADYKLNLYIDDNNVYESVMSFNNFVENLKITNQGWKDRIQCIFDYEDFTRESSGWGAYKLTKELAVNVCPYCNRQFINTLEKESKRIRATLDHYYAKSLYPYLAVSLFNLIPSCYFCNSILKGDEDFFENEAIYPYDEQFSKAAYFVIESSGYEHLIGTSSDFDIRIELKQELPEKEKRKIEKSIDTFAINQIYSLHKDYVKDLAKTTYVNNESRINELLSKYPDIINNREDVMRVIYINYFDENHLGKRVLAKLTNDVCNQLGVNKK